MKHRKWILLFVLVAAAMILGGCGVPREGVDITQTAPEGWWQQIVVWPMGRALVWLNGNMTNWGVPYHWGYAIIAFTIVVKVLTFPLTITQIRGMQAQKELQPKIQELQKKYGKDRERLSQEQMKLYQEAGVNPLSGCLPLIVQMPILFGLYSALIALGPSLNNSRFYWIPDLGFPKYTQGMSWIPEAFNAGEYGFLAAYLVLPLLLMGSQFFMQKWMTPATPTPSSSDNPMGGMTKQITLMMTFMFGFFTLQVPAGLTLYWVTSNLLQMLQQWIVTDQRFGIATAPAAASTTNGASSTSDGQGTISEVTTVSAGSNGSQPKTTTDKPKTSRRRRSRRR